MTMALMEAFDLCKTYATRDRLWRQGQATAAVNRVTLSIEEGQCLSIVGESGSGKSTLGRLLLALEKPSAGHSLFQNYNLQTASSGEVRRLRRDLQAVFQNSADALNPRMKAGDIVVEPLRNYERLSYRELRLKQEELLALVGLRAEDAVKYPSQFSGGQLQRLNIARALSLRPKLIVLDEAVSSLDQTLQHQILSLLADLKQQLGLSYLFITHQIQAACYLSDQLIVMERGAIVESINDIKTIEQVVHPASRRLLDARLPHHPRESSIC